MATILRDVGFREHVDLASLGLKERLHAIQEIVGGFIEAISLGQDKFMVYGEDAKARGEPLNAEATLIASAVIMPGDFIAGVAVIATQAELDA